MRQSLVLVFSLKQILHLFPKQLMKLVLFYIFWSLNSETVTINSHQKHYNTHGKKWLMRSDRCLCAHCCGSLCHNKLFGQRYWGHLTPKEKTSSASGEICGYWGKNLVNEEITACTDANPLLKSRQKEKRKSANNPFTVYYFHFLLYQPYFIPVSTDMMSSCFHSLFLYVSLMHPFCKFSTLTRVKWKARDTQV